MHTLIHACPSSGEIDFREFVIALWNYCTLGKAALILFAFDLYDNDNSGKIDIDEITDVEEEREEHAWARWLADPTRSPDPAAEEAAAEEAGDPEEVAAETASERVS